MPRDVIVDGVRYEPVDPGPGCLQGIVALMAFVVIGGAFLIWWISNLIQSNIQLMEWIMVGFVSFIVVFSFVKLMVNEHVEKPPILPKLISLFCGFMIATVVGLGVGGVELLLFLTTSGGLRVLEGTAACIGIIFLLALYVIGGVITTKLTKRSLMGGMTALIAQTGLLLCYIYVLHSGQALNIPSVLFILIISWLVSMLGGWLSNTIK